MSEPFLAEIKMFAGAYAPRGWASCDGQILPINQHQSLYSLLGITYGGDGRTTFGVPDFRGRIPVHAGYGSGPGLSHRILGSKLGVEKVTLTTNELPSHSHNIKAVNAVGNAKNGMQIAAGQLSRPYVADTSPEVELANSSILDIGGSRSHDNLMPYLCVHFIVALVGVYPSRN